jgi:hypothetical protein
MVGRRAIEVSPKDDPVKDVLKKLPSGEMKEWPEGPAPVSY